MGKKMTAKKKKEPDEKKKNKKYDTREEKKKKENVLCPHILVFFASAVCNPFSFRGWFFGFCPR